MRGSKLSYLEPRDDFGGQAVFTRSMCGINCRVGDAAAAATTNNQAGYRASGTSCFHCQQLASRPDLGTLQYPLWLSIHGVSKLLDNPIIYSAWNYCRGERHTATPSPFTSTCKYRVQYMVRSLLARAPAAVTPPIRLARQIRSRGRKSHHQQNKSEHRGRRWSPKKTKLHGKTSEKQQRASIVGLSL